MESKWLWVLCIVLVLCETEGCLEHERIALFHLKSFFNDPSGFLGDWKNTTNCCDWERVMCSVTSRRVIQLSLNYTRDQYGYLNISLFLPFTELKTLYLRGNNIYGFVDNQGFRKAASAFRKLEFLYLSYNYLNDSSLTSLSELSSLKSLYLSGNKFTGSDGINGFGKVASALGKLEFLELSDNYLNESILTSLSELSSLKSLYLARNKFTGSDDINGFPKLLNNLEVIDWSGNYFSGTILTWLSELSALKSLYLREAIFIGSEQANGIAKLSSKLKKLEILDLSRTKLSESIISSLSEVSSLKYLNLAINGFTGSNGFKWLSRLTNLKTLDLSVNKLKNNFLLDVGDLSSVETLDLSSNQFQGFVNMTELKRMRKLDLSYNAIESFDFIQGWCDLRNLEELRLRGNSLEGSIPSWFHNLTSLRFLDISENLIQLLPSFISLGNNSRLRYLLADGNSLTENPTFQTPTENPKFQLEYLSMSKCSTKGLILEKLPKFLYYQKDLRFVDLSYNNFGGETPSWLLENNTRLEEFIMSGNSLKGFLQIPQRANVHMSEIEMSWNKMQGQIPMNICSTYPNLMGLFLSQNAFEGNIPSCLGGLKSLLTLHLSYNNFSGGIPEEIAKSYPLGTLILSSNNLSGKIPPALFSTDFRRRLYLDDNNFDGEIPQLIHTSKISLFHLREIDLSNNYLSGKLPRWIWSSSGLEILALSNNRFDDDHIPHELCNLRGLVFLDLSQNNFSASVPSCFSSLTRLRHVQLSRNKLSGPMPRVFHNSSKLVMLDLSENNLTGRIPSWISTLSALRVLLLKANHFEGKIPSQICRLNTLSILDLSLNKLVGHIPSCLSNLTLRLTEGMPFLFMAEVRYTTKEYEGVPFPLGHSHPFSYVDEQVMFTSKKRLDKYSRNGLKYMFGIDLSCNRVTGKIPRELGNLNELHSLNLSHNNLIGPIPSTFSNLEQVESLDLSHNKLSGIIPIQLMELNSLAIFNVSYNNLSGGIPHEKAQFATFDESSYLGNQFLCGPPKHESCTKTGSTPTTANASDGEEESGFMDMHVFYVTFVVTSTIVLMTIGAVLVINPHWRRRWFYFIQQCIDGCYYFILDNVLGLSIFRRNL